MICSETSKFQKISHWNSNNLALIRMISRTLRTLSVKIRQPKSRRNSLNIVSSKIKLFLYWMNWWISDHNKSNPLLSYRIPPLQLSKKSIRATKSPTAKLRFHPRLKFKKYMKTYKEPIHNQSTNKKLRKKQFQQIRLHRWILSKEQALKRYLESLKHFIANLKKRENLIKLNKQRY